MMMVMYRHIMFEYVFGERGGVGGNWAAEWRVCNRRGRCCRRPWQILTRRDGAHWLIGPASFAKHVATGAEKQVGWKAPPVIIPPHSRVGSFPTDARLNLRRLVGRRQPLPRNPFRLSNLQLRPSASDTLTTGLQIGQPSHGPSLICAPLLSFLATAFRCSLVEKRPTIAKAANI
jgi:hypothetical protein